MSERTREAIIAALDAAGLNFFDDGKGGVYAGCHARFAIADVVCAALDAAGEGAATKLPDGFTLISIQGREKLMGLCKDTEDANARLRTRLTAAMDALRAVSAQFPRDDDDCTDESCDPLFLPVLRQVRAVLAGLPAQAGQEQKGEGE